MKKILITLLIFLFCIPLFGQELSLSKNNRKQQIENFFNTDTVDKIDTIYIVLEYEYRNNYYNPYSYYDWNFRYSYGCGFGYTYYYNNDFYWSCTHNWYYDNYHRHYSHNYYKPRPPRPIRQRTIATRVNHKPERKREYVRPPRKTETRYNRPQSTNRVKHVTNTSSRKPRTYNRPASTYNKPSSSQRRYNSSPVRSSSTKSGTSNRGSSTKSGTSNSSSGRSRR